MKVAGFRTQLGLDKHSRRLALTDTNARTILGGHPDILPSASSMTEPNHTTTADLARRLIALRFAPAEVAARVRAVYEAILRNSSRITTGNFSCVAPADLALLFDLYDEKFFASGVRQLVAHSGAPLNFSLSSRLTRSAGLTKRYAPRSRRGGPPAPVNRYEIVLSTTLLFQTFKDVERTIRVNGVVCNDRLEAAQRVFEHELLHLIEMLIWSRSSCDGENFKTLAWNYFAHSETRHDLVTQQERARAKFDVRVGDRVTFTFEGVRHVGVVNRITRRATILVENDTGAPYSDGKRYLKFYIPLAMLAKATA
jgi:hypothetical protein